MMEAGANEISFVAVGRNDASTSMRLGIDTLSITHSGIPREAEWQPILSSEGLVPSPANMGSNDVWSGNAILDFPATTVGQSFSLLLTNDCWEERNFFGIASNVVRTPVQVGGINTYALRLDGNGIAWHATNQLRSTAYDYETLFASKAVRILLRGSSVLGNGGHLLLQGSNLVATLRGKFQLERAFIALADLSNPDLPLNFLTNSVRTFTFAGSTNVAINGSQPSDPLPDFVLDTNAVYVVGMRVVPTTSPADDWMRAWPNTLADSTNAFVFENASSPESFGTWSLGRVYPSQTLPFLEKLEAASTSGVSEVAWEASAQTGNLSPENRTLLMGHRAVRIFIRGNDLWDGFDGGWIAFNGTNAWLQIAGGMNASDVFIAQSAVHLDPSRPMDIVSGTRREFAFRGASQTNVWHNWWTPVESDKLDYAIEKTNSYVVGMYIAPVWNYCIPVTWYGSTSSAINAYAIDNPDPGQTNSTYNWSNAENMWATRNAYGVVALRTGHSPEGAFVSRIMDTRLDDPTYLTFDWSASQPSNSAVEVRIRAGYSNDLSDAPAWTNVAAATSGADPVVNGRYVQAQVRMTPGTNALVSPQLDNLVLRWESPRFYVNISGIFSTGPDHDIYEVFVNGSPLLKGVTIDVAVTNSQYGIVSSAFAEIIPRN
jgi:hypothetical protein